MSYWRGFDFTNPRKSDLEQLNEKQRECAALETRVAELEATLADADDGRHTALCEDALTARLELAAAVAAEREECAKVCDENAASTREQRWWGTQESVALTFEAASEAIRARGAK